MKQKNEFYNNLSNLEDKVVELLTSGANLKKSDFRTPTLSTISEKNIPNSRIIILRDFFYPTWQLLFHSDKRSKKIYEIKKNSNLCLVFYDKKEKIQLRVMGKGKILKNYNNSWQKLGAFSKYNYACYKNPGETSEVPTSGINDEFKNDPRKSFKNFSTILVSINLIDWLYLSKLGNRRAEIKINRKSGVIATNKKWLFP